MGVIVPMVTDDNPELISGLNLYGCEIHYKGSCYEGGSLADLALGTAGQEKYMNRPTTDAGLLYVVTRRPATAEENRQFRSLLKNALAVEIQYEEAQRERVALENTLRDVQNARRSSFSPELMAALNAEEARARTALAHLDETQPQRDDDA